MYFDAYCENENILPGQLSLRGCLSASRERVRGELRLVVAVIEDALTCALGHATVVSGNRNWREGRVRNVAIAQTEALAWFESREVYPFSFAWCCSMLDLDPSWLRNGVRIALKNSQAPADGFLRFGAGLVPSGQIERVRMAFAAFSQKRSHCPAGHEYYRENVIALLQSNRASPNFICHTCHLARCRRSQARARRVERDRLAQLEQLNRAALRPDLHQPPSTPTGICSTGTNLAP